MANPNPNQAVLAYGQGGWRIMRRDDMGQWRNMLGAPKEPPRHWQPLPPVPAKVKP